MRPGTLGERRMNVTAPEPAKSTKGNAEFSGMSSQAKLANGRSQPPRNNVTATEHTTNRLAYSANM